MVSAATMLADTSVAESILRTRLIKVCGLFAAVSAALSAAPAVRDITLDGLLIAFLRGCRYP
jgi:hypothetical protein